MTARRFVWTFGRYDHDVVPENMARARCSESGGFVFANVAGLIFAANPAVDVVELAEFDGEPGHIHVTTYGYRRWDTKALLEPYKPIGVELVHHAV